jgi:hypothetical protein
VVPVHLHTLLISTQHAPGVSQDFIRDQLMAHVVDPVVPRRLIHGAGRHGDTRFLLNPSGSFVEGGPAADAGLTGRKSEPGRCRRVRGLACLRQVPAPDFASEPPAGARCPPPPATPPAAQSSPTPTAAGARTAAALSAARTPPRCPRARPKAGALHGGRCCDAHGPGRAPRSLWMPLTMLTLPPNPATPALRRSTAAPPTPRARPPRASSRAASRAAACCSCPTQSA